MLKKTITYEDFNGEEVTEDCYFHISKAELAELELSTTGGMQALLGRIASTRDQEALIREFKKIILLSYGRRSDDGRRFIKNPQILEEFTSSNAYSELFMELVTNDDAAIEFCNGIVPAEIQEAAKTEQQKTPPKHVTQKEVDEMTSEAKKVFFEEVARGEAILES